MSAECTTEFLNEQLATLGLPGLPAEVDVAVEVKNLLHATLNQAHQSFGQMQKVTTSLQCSVQDNQRLRDRITELDEKLLKMDQAKYNLEARLDKQAAEARAEKAKLNKTIKELSTKATKLQHKENHHEARYSKLEKELQTLKDRVNRERASKDASLKRGMTAVAQLRAKSGKGSSSRRTDSGLRKPVTEESDASDADKLVFQRIVDGYEEKLAVMEKENADNRDVVVSLERQLKVLVNTYERLRRAYLSRPAVSASTAAAPSSPSASPSTPGPAAGVDIADIEMEFDDILEDAPVSSPAAVVAAAFGWQGEASRAALTSKFEDTMKRLEEEMAGLEKTDDAEAEEGDAGADKPSTDAAAAAAAASAKNVALLKAKLSAAKDLLRTQHALLHKAVLASPGSPDKRSRDPEDDWALREVEAAHAKVREEKKAVVDKLLALDNERNELNMKWQLFEEARANFVSKFPGAAIPATPSRTPVAPPPVPVSSHTKGSTTTRRRLKMADTGAVRKPLGLRSGKNGVSTPLAIKASPATQKLVDGILGGNASSAGLAWVAPSPQL